MGLINRRIRRKGFTLIETLISTVILGILLFLVYQSFVPSIRKVKIADAKSQAQQNALVAYQKIFDEISVSNPKSLTIGEVTIAGKKRDCIAFLSYKPFVDSGAATQSPPPDIDMHNQYTTVPSITWTKFVIIYTGQVTAPAGNKVNVLLKKEIPYNKGAQVWRLKKEKVDEYVLSGMYAPYVMATNVVDASFYVPRYPSVTIDISSTRDPEVSQLKKDAINLESERFIFSVFPRN